MGCVGGVYGYGCEGVGCVGGRGGVCGWEGCGVWVGGVGCVGGRGCEGVGECSASNGGWEEERWCEGVSLLSIGVSDV